MAKKPDYYANTNEEMNHILYNLSNNLLSTGQSVRLKFVPAPGLWEVYLL